MVTPPCKTVKLDTDMINDDHVLSLYVMRKEDISVEQAAEEIRNFYQQNFVQKLSDNQSVTIDGLGFFSMNESGKIEFVPDANLFKTNYGFENVYITGKAPEPPAWNPVVPEPPILEPIVMPEPEPVFVPEPVQPPQPEIKETTDSQTNPGENLIDAGDNTRYRENTTRREPRYENQKPPTKQTPKSVSPRPKPKQKEKKEKAGNSYLLLLFILLGAAGLGVAGYLFYPNISTKISLLLEKIPFISSKTPVDKVVFEVQDEASEFTDETDESTPNTDIAQTLDDATDKKNALKPEGSQSVQSTQKTTTLTQSQGSVGRGKYGIIVASLLTQEDAEEHGRNLNKKHGYSYEVLEAVANGVKRYRVSVDSFDDWKESNVYVEKWKNKPDCNNAWPAKK